MRVCIIVDNPLTYDSRVLRQVRSLRAAGHAVTVIALEDFDGAPLPDLAGAAFVGVPNFLPRGRERRAAKRAARKSRSTANGKPPAQASLIRRLRHRGGRVIARGSRLIGYQRYLRRGVRLGRRAVPLRPDVCHANNLSSLPAALACKLLGGATVIYDSHELESNRTGFSKLARFRARVVERLCIRHADYVITVSDSFAAYLTGRYRIATPTVVRNVAARPSEEVVNASPRPTRGAVTVVSVGGVTIGRGLEQLVEALALVPDVHVLMVGPDRGMGAVLRQRAAALDVADRVEIRPPVPPDQLGMVLSEGDVGYCGTENVSLSYYLTLSNKPFLYLAYGLPVISSDLPEMRALLAGCGAGVLFDPASGDSLAEALTSIVRGDRESLRARALALAKENSWDREQERLLRVYDEVSERRTRRSSMLRARPRGKRSSVTD